MQFFLVCIIAVSCEQKQVSSDRMIEPNDSLFLKQIFKFTAKDKSYSVSTKFTWAGRQISLEESSWSFQGHRLDIKINPITGEKEFQIDSIEGKFSRNFYFSNQQQDQYIQALKYIVKNKIDSLIIGNMKQDLPLVSLQSLSQFARYFSKELFNEIQSAISSPSVLTRVSLAFDLETGKAGCTEDGFCSAEYSYCVTCEFDNGELPYVDCWGNHAERIARCIANYNQCIVSCWESGELETVYKDFSKKVKGSIPSLVEVPILIFPFDCGCNDQLSFCQSIAWSIFRHCLARRSGSRI